MCDPLAGPSPPWVFVLVDPNGNVVANSLDDEELVRVAHDRPYAGMSSPRVARAVDTRDERVAFWISPDEEKWIAELHDVIRRHDGPDFDDEDDFEFDADSGA
ncbi:hypothetical protein [Arhodomonas sp. AD133]|uniref:hypothetical protein n=1 Tax=Arhodomonas sp. AD133 TaxID=3415009 RepID=UPI003EC005F1